MRSTVPKTARVNYSSVKGLAEACTRSCKDEETKRERRAGGRYCFPPSVVGVQTRRSSSVLVLRRPRMLWRILSGYVVYRQGCTRGDGKAQKKVSWEEATMSI